MPLMRVYVIGGGGCGRRDYEAHSGEGVGLVGVGVVGTVRPSREGIGIGLEEGVGLGCVGVGGVGIDVGAGKGGFMRPWREGVGLVGGVGDGECS